MRSTNRVGKMCGKRLSFHFRINTATPSPDSGSSNDDSAHKTGALW